MNFSGKMIKRAIDILVSAAVLLVASPLLAVLLLAIRLGSPGAPLFFQQRVGRGSALFSIVKLRSMVAGAPSIGPSSTQKNDPRITRVGAFIRKTSLDELPQLWNVLTGDMSLVGPRPLLAADITYYTQEEWALRHSVRPGITGLAQVNGRSALNREQALAYDLAYAKNPSLKTDIGIALKTIRLVLLREGTN